MKKFILIKLCLCFAAGGIFAQSNVITTGSDFDPTLYVLDTANFNVLAQLHLEGTLGETFEDAYGLTRDNANNYYSVFTYNNGASLSLLGKIDINTGTVIVIDTLLSGSLTERISGLSFANNKLWGVTDEGSFTPQALYTINTSNAALTLVGILNYQGQGAAIGYCNSNQKLYSWAGDSLYKINPVTNAVSLAGYDTNGVLSAVNPFYPQSMLYIGNGKFLISGYYDSGNFWIADTLGRITASGKSYDNAINNVKGWVYVDQSHASIQGLSTFCEKDSVGLVHASLIGDNYQWTYNGTDIPGATNKMYLPALTGRYNCWINVHGDVDTAAVDFFVTIKPLPVVALSGDTFVCQGSYVVLTGELGGIGSQWYENGIEIPGATLNTFTVSGSGVYNQMKTDVNGCKDSAAVGLRITEVTTPSFTVVTDNNDICYGASTVIRASGTDVYSWSTGATGDTLLVSPLAATTYTVWGIDTLTGCSEPYTEFVFVIVPLVNITADRFALCTGDSTILRASGGAMYVWEGGAQEDTLKVMPATTATYSVIGTDVNGCIDTTSYLMFVHNNVPVVTASAGDTVCMGTSVMLTSGGSDIVTYLWSTAATTSNIVVYPTAHITYELIVKNGCGSDTASVEMNVFSLPAITFSISPANNDTLCASAGSFSLSGSPIGGVFSGTAVTGNLFDPSSASVGWNIITYSYTDINGCTNLSPRDSVYVLNCTGIAESKNNSQEFTMYPNPSSGQITIRSSEQINAVTIFNSLGEVVYNSAGNNEQLDINLNEPTAGIYFVRVNNEVRKLIID